jgi:hypothetical protein
MSDTGYEKGLALTNGNIVTSRAGPANGKERIYDFKRKRKSDSIPDRIKTQ